jgi:hypothetical protein
MDGILTYTGVSVFGSSQAEGNPLVKSLIDFYGLGPGLTLAKGFGCFFLVLLYNILKELVEVSLKIITKCPVEAQVLSDS